MIAWWHSFEALIMGATASPWALVILFFLAIGDGAIPPLPSETFLSALAAAAATRSSIQLHLLILVGAAGALTGDMLMYGIGRLLPIPPNSKRERLIARIDRTVNRSWPVLLGAARFIPVIRVAIFLAAGAKRIDWRKVILIDSVSALVWATWFAFAGFTGGLLLRRYPLLGMLVGMIVGSLAGILMGFLAQKFVGSDKPTKLTAEDTAATDESGNSTKQLPQAHEQDTPEEIATEESR